jgi:hypothetical protein
VYVDKLPETVTGEEFIKKYVNHEDSVTTIDPKHIYAVKAPTRHPVYENFRVEVSNLYSYGHYLSNPYTDKSSEKCFPRASFLSMVIEIILFNKFLDQIFFAFSTNDFFFFKQSHFFYLICRLSKHY